VHDQNHVATRNANIKEILRGLKLGMPSMDVFNQFNHVFIIGDLNYRLNFGKVRLLPVGTIIDKLGTQRDHDTVLLSASAQEAYSGGVSCHRGLR